MARKKRKPKTIGEMCNSRVQWHIKPVTQVKRSKKAYSRKGFDINKHI